MDTIWTIIGVILIIAVGTYIFKVLNKYNINDLSSNSAPPRQESSRPHNFPASIPRANIPADSITDTKPRIMKKKEEDTSQGEEEERFKWILESDAEWGESSWGCSHFVVAGISLLFYGIPMLIFIAITWWSRYSFNKGLKASHQKAADITQCGYLAQFLHLGGHPDLPYHKPVLVGLKNSNIHFYDLYLEELHSIPVSLVKIATDTRHASATSFGNTYSPRDSNFGVSTSSTSINMHPDTIIMNILINGEAIQAVFDVNYYDPLEFVQIVNQIRTSRS